MYLRRKLHSSIAFLLTLVCIGFVHAHPFHISTAEMEFNSKSKKFEVSLKLHFTDLADALQKMHGKRVDLEKDDCTDLLVEYLDSRFYLMPESVAKQIDAGETVADEVARSKVIMVGREVKSNWLWIYFEVQPAVGDQPLAIVNTVLLDQVDGQINTVSIRHEAQRHAMKMTVKEPWHPFARTWMSSTAANATSESVDGGEAAGTGAGAGAIGSGAIGAGEQPQPGR